MEWMGWAYFFRDWTVGRCSGLWWGCSDVDFAIGYTHYFLVYYLFCRRINPVCFAPQISCDTQEIQSGNPAVAPSPSHSTNLSCRHPYMQVCYASNSSMVYPNSNVRSQQRPLPSNTPDSHPTINPAKTKNAYPTRVALPEQIRRALLQVVPSPRHSHGIDRDLWLLAQRGRQALDGLSDALFARVFCLRWRRRCQRLRVASLASAAGVLRP